MQNLTDKSSVEKDKEIGQKPPEYIWFPFLCFLSGEPNLRYPRSLKYFVYFYVKCFIIIYKIKMLTFDVSSYSLYFRMFQYIIYKYMSFNSLLFPFPHLSFQLVEGLPSVFPFIIQYLILLSRPLKAVTTSKSNKKYQ